MALLTQRDVYAAVIASSHWETLLDRVPREEGGHVRETDAAQLATNRQAMDALDRADVALKVSRRGAADIRVDPYPFGVDPLRVSFPSRLVADRAYASQGEFLDDFFRAPLVYSICTLVP